MTPDAPALLLFLLAFLGAGYLYFTYTSGTMYTRLGNKFTRESDPIGFDTQQLVIALVVAGLLIVAIAKFFWWFWGAL